MKDPIEEFANESEANKKIIASLNALGRKKRLKAANKKRIQNRFKKNEEPSDKK